jgi:signal transduction histidine kinase
VSLVAACCLVLALAGLGAAAAAVSRLRSRLEAVARAEHELRGPATALLLACERLARDPSAGQHVAVLGAQLDRLVAGLADLQAARTGRRPTAVRDSVDLGSYTRSTLAVWEGPVRVSLDWRLGPARIAADRGRLAQVLGNVIANAAEHGAGEVRVRGRRGANGVRVEVSNPHPERPGAGGPPAAGERGRGLDIAARAARDLGGRLLVESDEQATLAVLELPEQAARAQDRAA